MEGIQEHPPHPPPLLDALENQQGGSMPSGIMMEVFADS